MAENFTLSSKAMLVFLSIRAWGGTKLDRGETERVTRENQASKDALRVTKDLVGDKLDEVRSSERQIRAAHRKYSLPWADDNTRLLPTAAFSEYQSELAALIDRHKEVIVPRFVERYNSEVIPAARDRLGALFNPNDFPADIGSKFGVSLRVLPVPEAGDVRVNLSKAEVAALREEVEEATRDAYRLANQDIVERATKPLARLAEALTEFVPGKNRLSKALLENVSEIASLMPILDIGGSPVIKDLADDIAALVDGLSTDRLAHNSRARAVVAAKATDLADKLSSIM